MPELAIQFDDNRTSFEPGEKIWVRLEWDLPDPPESIELRAVWNTVGKGTTDIGVEHSITFDSPNQRDSRRVHFPLPEGPYSFSGQLISVIWALELVVEPTEQSFRVEFTMAPGEKEIVLQRVEESSKLGMSK